MNKPVLSRQPSHQSILQQEDTSSLTSFPDPEDSTPLPTPTPTITTTELSNRVPIPLPESSNGIIPVTGTGTLHSLLETSGGPSIFDDERQNQQVDLSADPQTLSAASLQALQAVLDHRGAASLTRRLATLLAERDAHITALTRLAEEYKIPAERIADAGVRAKQAERRRMSLAKALEDDVPRLRSRERSEVDSVITAPKAIESGTGTIRGFTKLFGGVGRRQGQNDVSTTSASSRSRSTSRAPATVRRRPKSIDATSVQSVQSAQSGESAGWTSMFVGSSNSRRDSRPTREPVELITRRDKEQLPPTLSDEHEDPQEAAWNQFLLKLKQSHEQNGGGGPAYGGGIIGASHFGQEGTMGQQKQKRLNALVLGGIPIRLRHPLWMELSNTDQIAEPDAYQYYLSLHDQYEQSEIDAILKDVPRTLTSKYDFYAKKGFKRLKEVLVAFVGRYDDLGYSQGLNTIAGYLLLVSPSEEDAFWLLCNIVENFFPTDYFSRRANMAGPLADNIVIRKYVEEHMPQLAKHMDHLGIPADRTVPLSWFYTAFSSVLSQDVLMRIWDVWLCLPGQKAFVFNVALAILMQNATALMECADEGEYMGFMSNEIKVEGDAEWVGDLIRQAFGLRKKLEGIEERRELETKVLRRKQGSMEALIDVGDEE